MGSFLLPVLAICCSLFLIITVTPVIIVLTVMTFLRSHHH